MTYLLADGAWTGSESQLRPARPDWPACSSAAPSISSFRGGTMSVSRRIFIRDGVATVTLGLAAPSFLSAIAHAQGLPNGASSSSIWVAATTHSTR